MMTRYKVTAKPIKHPMFYTAASEDEAWEKAKQAAKRDGKTLYNGKVEKVPSDLETIATQAARIAELEAGLEAATAELEMQLCIRWNCTHDEIRAVNKYVIAARALLETK